MIPAYRGLLRAHIGVGLAYRAQLAVWVLTSIFPLLSMAIWLAVVDEVGPAAGWDRTDFVSYYAAAALLYQTTSSFLGWTWDADLRSGDLSFKLLKPIHPFHQYLTQEVGFRLVVMAVLVPGLVVLTIIIPDLTYPPSPIGWLLTLLAAATGFLLNIMMAMAFATIGFWSTQAASIYYLWWGTGAFLSGWIVPLSLLPDPVEAAGLVLPFRSSMGFPLEILLDRLTSAEIMLGFATTAAWIVVFAILFRWAWRLGIRRYQAVGG